MVRMMPAVKWRSVVPSAAIVFAAVRRVRRRRQTNQYFVGSLRMNWERQSGLKRVLAPAPQRWNRRAKPRQSAASGTADSFAAPKDFANIDCKHCDLPCLFDLSVIDRLWLLFCSSAFRRKLAARADGRFLQKMLADGSVIRIGEDGSLYVFIGLASRQLHCTMRRDGI